MSIGRTSRSSQNGPTVGMVPLTWRTRTFVILTGASRSGHGREGAPALEPGDEIADDALAHRPHCLLRAAGDVRGEDDVIEAKQGLGHARLVIENVEAGGAQATVGERFDERGLV